MKKKTETPFKRRIIKERIARDILNSIMKNVFEEIKLKDTDSTIPIPSNTSSKSGLSKSTLSFETIGKTRIVTNNPICFQLISDRIDTLVMEILGSLSRFQHRLRTTNPVKARMKKRFVLGISEVSRWVKTGDAKCVIIASNVGKEPAIKEVLSNLIHNCTSRKIPVIFALNRFLLGRSVNKKASVSVLAIIDPDGVFEEYKKLLNMAVIAQEAYSKSKTVSTSIQLKIEGIENESGNSTPVVILSDSDSKK